MAIAENSYPQKMRNSCLQILHPKIWFLSEISDPKTWHAHPRMQTWQVPPPPPLGLETLIFLQIGPVHQKLWPFKR